MKKIIGFLRWFLYGVIIAGLGALLAYIVYPIAYLLRKPLRKAIGSSTWKYIALPLWSFLDDTEFDDYGVKWWRKANGYSEDYMEQSSWYRFKIAYHWGAIRNPIWNTYSYDPLEEEDIRYSVSATGVVVKDGRVMGHFVFAGLKYVDTNGKYMDNKGIFLSRKYSRLGKKFHWYGIEGKSGLYWSYSYANPVNNKVIRFLYSIPYNISAIFNGNELGVQDYYTELQLGSNSNRFTIRYKIKQNLIVYEDIVSIEP